MRLNRRDDSGVTTILVVFCATVLLAAVAIAVDVGRAVAVTRSAQNSADAVTLAMAKDCVQRGVLSAGGYDSYIRTSSAIGNGQTASLTAGSCAAGSVTATAHETMNYSFAKVIGMTNTTLDRPATAKWSQLSSGVIFPFTFSACAFPDSFTPGDATTEGTKLMLYGQGRRTSCDRDPNTTGQSRQLQGIRRRRLPVRTSLDRTPCHDAKGNSFIGTNCDVNEPERLRRQGRAPARVGFGDGRWRRHRSTRSPTWSGSTSSVGLATATARQGRGDDTKRCTTVRTRDFTPDPTTRRGRHQPVPLRLRDQLRLDRRWHHRRLMHARALFEVPATSTSTANQNGRAIPHHEEQAADNRDRGSGAVRDHRNHLPSWGTSARPRTRPRPGKP